MDERERHLWEEYKSDRFCMMTFLSGADSLVGEDVPRFRTIDLGLANLRDALISLDSMVRTVSRLKHYRETIVTGRKPD